MSDLRGVKVVVTGAGGFIGSALVERLVADGARLRAFVRYNSRNQRGWLDALPEETSSQLDVFAGDLKDHESVARAVEGHEIVLHLGALIAIPYSYVNPLDFVQTNVLGTAHVLDACRRAGVARLVHTSTSEVYGTARYVPIDEAHPVLGQSPYSASKIAADQLVESYHRSFGLPVATLRPFNTFGPRQSARAVIPSLATQCLAGSEVALGSTEPTRDFTYVDDTVEGFVRIATADRVEGEVVNLGTGREISIADLFERIRELTGSSASLVRDEARVRPGPSEVERLCSDPGKARELLGWEPRTRLEDGLKRTIDWLKRHASLYRADHYHV